jgi:hypothetical protein
MRCQRMALLLGLLLVVSGKVMEEGGAGVHDLTVKLAPGDPGGGRGDIITATDASGAFRFDDLPPGAYSLEVTSGGGAIYREELHLTQDVRREITVRRNP